MTLLSVPDMNCGHCRASVESALSALPGVGEIAVDLQDRQVSVAGAIAPAQLIAALGEIGFPASVIDGPTQR